MQGKEVTRSSTYTLIVRRVILICSVSRMSLVLIVGCIDGPEHWTRIKSLNANISNLTTKSNRAMVRSSHATIIMTNSKSVTGRPLPRQA